MGNTARGKHALFISDRSGLAYPYTEMVKEWNGSLVHISEFEPKHPQIRRRHATSDAIALQNTRSQKFQQPQTVASNDTTVANSGGTMVGVANLTLPGNFAFITAQPANVLTSAGVVISTMKPADPSLQNRRRKLIMTTGTVTVSIT